MARDRDDRPDDRDDDGPRRRARDEDYEREERLPSQTTNPGAAKAAAILWIVFGALVVGAGLYKAMILAALGGFTVDVIIQLAVGAAFLITGIQTLMGAVSGILGAGIASVVLASLALILVAVPALIFGGAAVAGGAGGLFMLVVLTFLIGPSMLMIAGILAIVACKKYGRWRAYKRRMASAGRGRERYEDEEDDRPRRRPSRDEE